MAPCDVVILNGSAVVNESMLTGESVPQMKESIVNNEVHEVLQMNKEHKRNIIFGGTKVVLAHPPAAESGIKSKVLLSYSMISCCRARLVIAHCDVEPCVLCCAA